MGGKGGLTLPCRCISRKKVKYIHNFIGLVVCMLLDRSWDTGIRGIFIKLQK